jgi:hypothetical protein
MDILTQPTVLIAIGVIALLLVAAGGAYLWYKKSSAATAAAAAKHAADVAAAALHAITDENAGDTGTNCHHCGGATVIASDDNRIRDCMKCKKRYAIEENVPSHDDA